MYPTRTTIASLRHPSFWQRVTISLVSFSTALLPQSSPGDCNSCNTIPFGVRLEVTQGSSAVLSIGGTILDAGSNEVNVTKLWKLMVPISLGSTSLTASSNSTNEISANLSLNVTTPGVNGAAAATFFPQDSCTAKNCNILPVTGSTVTNSSNQTVGSLFTHKAGSNPQDDHDDGNNPPPDDNPYDDQSDQVVVPKGHFTRGIYYVAVLREVHRYESLLFDEEEGRTAQQQAAEMYQALLEAYPAPDHAVQMSVYGGPQQGSWIASVGISSKVADPDSPTQTLSLDSPPNPKDFVFKEYDQSSYVEDADSESGGGGGGEPIPTFPGTHSDPSTPPTVVEDKLSDNMSFKVVFDNKDERNGLGNGTTSGPSAGGSMENLNTAHPWSVTGSRPEVPTVYMSQLETTPTLPVNMTFGLGRDATGQAQGMLFYSADLSQSSSLLSLSNFRFNDFKPGALQKQLNNGVYTISSNGGSAVIQELNSGALVRLTFTHTGEPTVVHELTRIAPSGQLGWGLQHTETKNGETQTTRYFGSLGASGGREWREETPDGRIRQGTESPWLNGLCSIETREWKANPAGGAALFVSRSIKTYAEKDWGVVLLSESYYNSNLPNAQPDITTYTYFENESDAGYGQVKWTTQSGGQWVRYSYGTDHAVNKTYRPWRDYPASPADATDSNCRLTLSEKDKTTEKILGRIHVIHVTNVRYDAPHPFKAFFDSLRSSETGLYPEGYSHPFMYTPWNPVTWEETAQLDQYGKRLDHTATLVSASGDVKTIFSLDGMGRLITKYTQPDGTTIEEERAFTSNEGTNPIAHPTVQIREINAQGRLVKETLRWEDHTLTTQEHFYDSAGRLIQTKRNSAAIYDRSRTVNNLGQEVITETDAYGTVTRSTSTVDGTLLKTEKLGVNGTPILTTNYLIDGLTETEETLGGSLKRTRTTTRDYDGRVTSETDEEGRTTTYVYENSGRRVTKKDGSGNVLSITEQYLDGQLKSITGPAVVAEYHDYELNEDGMLVETIRYGSATSPQWRTITRNGIGQTVEEKQPATEGQVRTTSYTYQGRMLTKTESTGSPTVLSVTGIGGQTSIVEGVVTSGVFNDNLYISSSTGSSWNETSNSAWQHDSQAKSTLDTIIESHSIRRRLDLGVNEQTITTALDGTEITSTTVVNRATKTATTTTTSNRSPLTAVRIVVNGVVQSESTLSASTPVQYEYDALERPTTIVDAAGITRKQIYDNTSTGIARSRIKEEQVKPAGATAFLTERTYTYITTQTGNYGRLSTVTDAAGATTTYTYNALGQVLRQTGTAAYPLRYEYDALGRMTKLHTYRAASPDLDQPGDLTEWIYDPASGLLTEKKDATGASVHYTYYPNGRLHTRQWARGVTTTYTYDTLGRVLTVDYSDTTPDVTYTYSGMLTSRTDGAGTTTIFGLNGGDQVETWGDLSLNLYLPRGGQPLGWSLRRGESTLAWLDRSYVTSGESASVSLHHGSSPTATWTYTHTPATGRLATLALSREEQTLLTKSLDYDELGRVEGISYANNSGLVLGWDYGYDPVMRARRTSTTSRVAGLPGWSYGYNTRGEVTSAERTAANATIPGQSWGYGYDGLGNRLSSTRSTPENTTLTTTYTANALNQYASLSHPAALEVSGVTATGVPRLTVNGQPIEGRPPGNGEPEGFTQWIPVDNATTQWPDVEVIATQPEAGFQGQDKKSIQRGHRYLAPATEAPQYDLDGNLTQDGQWTYTWDAENRLISMQMLEAGVPLAVPLVKLEFSYDGLSRRISKRVLERRATGKPTALVRPAAWTLREERWFVYEGWNVIAEFDKNPSTSADATLLHAYAWGSDLSRTLAGAGGVGGLLGQMDGDGQLHAVCTEIMGNVMGLVHVTPTTATLTDRYDYDAFGKQITHVHTGGATTPTTECSFGFSTKYTDEETGLCYYGYRYYSPEMGRWISRDPMGELGGMNLLSFIRNRTCYAIDNLGLQELSPFDVGPSLLGPDVNPFGRPSSPFDPTFDPFKPQPSGSDDPLSPYWDPFAPKPPEPPKPSTDSPSDKSWYGIYKCKRKNGSYASSKIGRYQCGYDCDELVRRLVGRPPEPLNAEKWFKGDMPRESRNEEPGCWRCKKEIEVQVYSGFRDFSGRYVSESGWYVEELYPIIERGSP